MLIVFWCVGVARRRHRNFVRVIPLGSAYFIGSVPTLRAANRGVEDHRIKLGCVQPGEMIANYAASRLRLEALEPYLWRDVNDLDLKKLWE